MPEGPDSYALSLTEDGVVRIPPRLRERYLTEHVDEAIVQATGYELTIWIWSERENVKISLPLDDFRAERPYTRSLSSSWGVNVNRWRTPGKHTDGKGVCWNNTGALIVGYGGSSGKEMVDATVETFEGEMPDV